MNKHQLTHGIGQRLRWQHSDASLQSDEGNGCSGSTKYEKHASTTTVEREKPFKATEHRVITLPKSMPHFINYEHMKLPSFAWPLCAALAYHGLMQNTDCQSCMADIASPSEYLLLP